MLIKYKGSRNPHCDTLYHTGDWTPEQTKDIPESIAPRLLQHSDVFEENVAAGKPDILIEDDQLVVEAPDLERVEILTEKKDENESEQDMRDAINAMTEKDSIIDWCRLHYGQNLSKRTPLDKLKLQAIQLIDQYGVL